MKNSQDDHKIFNKLVSNSNSTLAKKYIDNLRLNKDEIGIYELNRVYTREEILNNIIFYTIKIYGGKFQRKSFFLIQSDNSANWIFVFIALKVLNLISLIIPSSFEQKDLEHLKKNFGNYFSFQFDKLNLNLNDNLTSNQSSLKDISFKSNIFDFIFTTGTTGKPKGVIIPEESGVYTATTLILKSKQDINDFELLSMPFSHSFGLARLRTCLITGQKLFVTSGLKDFPSIYKKLIDLEINGLSLVPAGVEIFRQMVRNKSMDLGNRIKYFEIGSSSLGIESREWLKVNFKNTNIFHHYGMTEASRSFFITRGAKDDLNTEIAHVGDPARGVKFKIKENKNSSNHQGEILINGPHLAYGYFTVSKSIKVKKINDWFETKDVGRIYNKRLILIGKLNTMINVGGEKVYPEKIEKFIETEHDALKVLCFGMKDITLGEVVAMLVENSPYFNCKDKILYKLKFTVKKLPVFERPKKIIFVNKLPLTKSGKKIRNKDQLNTFLEK